ncbi:Receptor-like protein kinase FERONIA [Vitis vinifera]|uniref:non-specific serine/threonine protein kinase n=1 Tax=Vitis vinifera TaxID=29760 RepID=A0A438HE44_VITVI|nr:Receptor-like protein kinase FERONIA [Vitis vinifera]
MQKNSCRYLVILTFVYSSFFHGHLAIAATSDCRHLALDDRGWMGDVGSKFTSSRLLNQTSVSAKASHSHGFSIDPVPYMTVRFFRSQFTYTFHVKPGQKFIRLHFYPASFPGFERSEAFFSVKAGPYTLLSNFSPSHTADALGVKVLVKEFSVNINDNQRSINITFLPSSNARKDAFAFINGIEIVSMPANLYCSRSRDIDVSSSGHQNDFLIKKNTALEAVHRLNVGGSDISPNNDSGISTRIPNYIAPAQVYRTARSVGMDKEVNMRYNLTWKLPVDPGFKYLVRLHFCAFQGQTKKSGNRKFHIYINNETAEANADVITWSGGNGIPIYRDYIVFIQKGNPHLVIALLPNSDSKTRYSEAILNGLEIFKINKSDGSLARPSPVPLLFPAPQPAIFWHSSQLADKSRINKSSLIAIGWSALGGVALLSIIVVIVLSWRRLGKSKKREVLSVPKEQCRQFSLAEIRAATNNFDKALVIGEGGFGRVFKGYINGGETPVAIKGLKPTSQQGAHEFWTEIDMLSRLRHLHLVSLIGYCNDPQAMILVYDYMAQGSLRDHLYKTDKAPLTWKQRLEICIGAARGLKHLHQGSERKIIHRDIKTTNILLDGKWVAKVSDFGLCKVGAANMSKSHITTDVKGTFGYLDPEYFWSQKLTEKSDVYAFGVVLFEVLCARPAVDMELEEEQQSLSQWAKHCVKKGTLEQIIDPYLMGKIAPESLKQSADAGEFDSKPGGAYSEKLDEAVYLCPREIELLSIPSRAESLAYTCPALWQRSMSPKVLIRFLSDKAGIKRPRPSRSEYQRMPHDHGQAQNEGTTILRTSANVF